MCSHYDGIRFYIRINLKCTIFKAAYDYTHERKERVLEVQAHEFTIIGKVSFKCFINDNPNNPVLLYSEAPTLPEESNLGSKNKMLPGL